MTDRTKVRPTDHGTTYGYWKGCRCPDCREAARIDRKANRDRKRALAPTTPIRHDTRWMEAGECVGANPDWWFPFDDRGNGRTQPGEDSAYALARTICNTCPVAEQCLEYALATRERRGMWGATTPTERSLILRRRKAVG